MQLALSRNDSTPRSGPMAASLRDLEHAAQLQFVRAQKAEQKAEDLPARFESDAQPRI